MQESPLWSEQYFPRVESETDHLIKVELLHIESDGIAPVAYSRASPALRRWDSQELGPVLEVMVAPLPHRCHSLLAGDSKL